MRLPYIPEQFKCSDRQKLLFVAGYFDALAEISFSHFDVNHLSRTPSENYAYHAGFEAGAKKRAEA